MHRDDGAGEAVQDRNRVLLDQEVGQRLAPEEQARARIEDRQLGAPGVGHDDAVGVVRAQRVHRPERDAPRHRTGGDDAGRVERVGRQVVHLDPAQRVVGQVQLAPVRVVDRVGNVHDHGVHAAARPNGAQRRAARRAARDDGAGLRVGAVPGRRQVAGVAADHHALR